MKILEKDIEEEMVRGDVIKNMTDNLVLDIERTPITLKMKMSLFKIKINL